MSCGGFFASRAKESCNKSWSLSYFCASCGCCCCVFFFPFPIQSCNAFSLPRFNWDISSLQFVWQTEKVKRRQTDKEKEKTYFPWAMSPRLGCHTYADDIFFTGLPEKQSRKHFYFPPDRAKTDTRIKNIRSCHRHISSTPNSINSLSLYFGRGHKKGMFRRTLLAVLLFKMIKTYVCTDWGARKDLWTCLTCATLLTTADRCEVWEMQSARAS